MAVKNKRKSSKAKNNQDTTRVIVPKKVIEDIKINEKMEESDINKDVVIQKLIKQKEDLEQEFTEILEFILGDMKKQEEVIANSMNEKDSTNEMFTHYKNQYAEVKKQVTVLEEQNKKLQSRVHALENSFLGRITVKYWKVRNRRK